MHKLYLDFETRSEIDLKDVGAAVYAAHPSTEIICMSFMFEDKLHSINLLSDQVDSNEDLNLFRSLVERDDTLLVAHNAEFEYYMYNFKLSYDYVCAGVPIKRWRDTMAVCAYRALPQSLEEAAKALGLTQEKDTEGRRLMLKMCKPRRPTKHNKAKWHETPEDVERLIQYCEQDVITEKAISDELGELPDSELELWHTHLKMNTEGVAIDTELVDFLLSLIEAKKEEYANSIQILTNYEITESDLRSPKRLLEYFKSKGVNLPDTKAETISTTLRATKDEWLRQVLDARLAMSKTSTAKLTKLKAYASYDGRARGTLNYHGATTGRWAGRGIQPHNFPRPDKVIKKDPDAVINKLKSDPSIFEMELAKKLLRSCLIAGEGHTLIGADYSSIEPRVLFWLVGHEKGLKLFREGNTVYEDMAATVFDIPVEEVNEEQRALGKEAILGCGYGMGHEKFKLRCESRGVNISEEFAQEIVDSYRDKYKLVKSFWYGLESRCVLAIKNPGKIITFGKLRIGYAINNLQIKLPSGRVLFYPYATLSTEDTFYGKKKVIKYKTNNTFNNNKFCEVFTYGGRLVENVVQAIARDILSDTILRLEKNGLPVILTVHDEIICEIETGRFSNDLIDQFTKYMNQTKEWAKGLPVESEAWYGKRYGK